MALDTYTVLGSDGVTVVTLRKLADGRAAAASSVGVALSNEDKTAIDLINTNLTTLDGRVDGLETLITSTNTKLDTVNTNLGTIDGRVDGLETLITATNTKLDTLIADTTISSVYAPTFAVSLSPSVENTALDAGDVAWDSEVLANITDVNDRPSWLMDMVVIDKADQKAAMTIFLFGANVSLGTEDAAPSITDADAANIWAVIDIPAGAYDASTNPYGWRDLGGVSVAIVKGANQLVKPASGTKNCYCAGMVAGTPTFTSTGLTINFAFGL